jgi:SAM-dependent methyltransferase
MQFTGDSMNRRIKALAHGMISAMPFRRVELRYYFQQKVTKSLPRSPEGYQRGLEGALTHLASFRRFSKVPVEKAHFYEFGAGWDLLTPLVFYSCGVNRQTVIDIWRFVDYRLLNHTIAFLRDCNQFNLRRKPLHPLGPESAVADLERFYGIQYLAPVDARNTGLAGGAFDCITSTVTMEHIPQEDIEVILCECRRIMKREGILSLIIDYQDHFSYFDRSLSKYNFLQYSNRRWAIYNPPSHYQNRLRHCDYADIISRSGFEILLNTPDEPTVADIEVLSTLPLAKRFRSYAVTDLAIIGGRFVARRPQQKHLS